jgi:hypothetical protein
MRMLFSTAVQFSQPAWSATRLVRRGAVIVSCALMCCVLATGTLHAQDGEPLDGDPVAGDEFAPEILIQPAGSEPLPPLLADAVAVRALQVDDVFAPPVDEADQIRISPRFRLPALDLPDPDAEELGAAEEAAPAVARAANYTRIYNSIPFSRAEFDANPDYRHEATMELLLGQLRSKTIHYQTAPQAAPMYDPIYAFHAAYSIPYRYRRSLLGYPFNYYSPFTPYAW